MKICGIICEYNPFHYGHLHLLEEARRLSGCDAVICIMSGSFVQRGDAALLGRYQRARHAVLAGADAVIELPAVFSTSSAENFARGAVKIFSAVPGADCLAFGVEGGTEEEFLNAASAMKQEPESVSKAIGDLLRNGTSYVRARAQAWNGKIPDLFSSPNNILGLEYAKAALSSSPRLRLLPVRRVGGGYSDEETRGKFSSAAAIRAALDRGDFKAAAEAVPGYVAESLSAVKPGGETRLEALEKYALLNSSADTLKKTADCTEGLENALRKAAEKNTHNLPSSLASKRYTSSRIRRILVQNLLGISADFIRECLSSPLYLRVLAADARRKEIMNELGKAAFPLLVRTSDEKKTGTVADACAKKDEYAARVLSYVRGFAAEKRDVFLRK